MARETIVSVEAPGFLGEWLLAQADYRAWGTATQPQKYRCGDSAQHLHGHHRAERVRQVVAGLRHHLRRRAAALRRNAFSLRAPVPRSNGASGGGFDRRLEPGDLD